MSNVNGKQLPKKKITTKTVNTFLRTNRNILNMSNIVGCYLDPKRQSVQQLIFAYSQSIPTSSAQICVHASRTHVILVHTGRMDKCNMYNTTICAKDEIVPYQSAFFSCQRRRLELVSFLGIRGTFKRNSTVPVQA